MNTDPYKPLPSILELKRLLIGRGFEIYRTVGKKVQLAERVRDNLLMDGNVAVSTGDWLELHLVTRAQQGHFPNETEGQLFERARACGATAEGRGYREVATQVVVISDPGNAIKTLDTWYEVTFVREVHDLDELTREAGFALALDKIA